MWDEIVYPFPNFNSATMMGSVLIHVSKMGPWNIPASSPLAPFTNMV